MRRFGIAATAALMAVLAASAGAASGRVIECGNWGDHGDGRMRWGMSDIYGAGIYNVTTRRVSCRTARRFVRRYRGTDTYFPKWDCREINRFEFSDVRCTASGSRVIRWQAGA